MADVERLLAVQNYLGEGPLWNTKEQRLYWIDLTPGILFRWSPTTGQTESFKLGFSIGCIGLRAKGGLVMGAKHGFMTWDEKNGAQPIINPIANQPDMRFNDGKVDARGRFYAGTMHEKDVTLQTGDLYRLDPDGSVHTMASNLRVPNGAGWSLDKKTMYFTDSPTHTIYAYDYDAATGNIENRRPFVVVPDSDGVPDGMTVDSEGFIWSAQWGGWRITRYDPTGKIERVVPMPVERPSSCAFGGKNLDELYITSAATTITPEGRVKQPWIGDVLRIYPGVKGLPEPEFGG
jgi:sugar lactone lactonase YvrE